MLLYEMLIHSSIEFIGEGVFLDNQLEPVQCTYSIYVSCLAM